MSQGAPTSMLEGGGSRLEGLAGNEAEHGGGGERRRRCSGKGTAARGGGIASRDQGKAN